jgi:hypothetical protein
MSKTDQFWLYAKEAIHSASYAKTDEEWQGLLNLGRTWTQAALLERASSVDHDSTPRPLPHRQLLEPNSVAGGYIDDQRIS